MPSSAAMQSGVRLQAAEAKFREATALAEHLRRKRNELIREAAAGGASRRSLAELLGLSKGRIDQIVTGGD